MSFIKKLIITTSMILAAGCASNASQQGQAPATENKAPEELKKDPNKKPDSGTTSIDGYKCDGGSGLNFKQGEHDIEGNSLSLFTGRNKNKKTLCEVLKSTGKKAAIFQFAGWFCLSCMDEAKLLQKFVASSKGKDVAHVVVFTDLFEDSKDSEYQEFVDKYAPKATIMYDESKLWKYYSKDPALPMRSTVMTMNLNAEGHVINEEGQFEKILEAATELAENL